MMSKPVADAAAVAAVEETSRQCILYYSNPNFINDQGRAIVQFGNEEDDEDDEEDDDEEEEEEEYEDDNDAIKAHAFDEHPNHHEHHQHHHHHQQQQQQQHIPGTQGVDDHGSLEDQEIDVESSYADYYEQDTSESRATSMIEGSIRSRQRQFSQQRFLCGSGGSDGGGAGGPGPYLGCLYRTTVACLRTKPCLFFFYVLVVLILLSSFVSVVLVAVLVVEPFARVSGFVNGTCRTLEVSVGHEEQSCSCGKGCNSKYLCLKIQVEYYDVQASALLTAILYEDETSLNRQCSFYPSCRSSRHENEEAVRVYERLYGRAGLEFSCWYNPINNSSSHVRRTAAAAAAAAIAKVSGGGEVIQNKRFQAHHVAHGLVWSTLLFVGSFIFLFYMFRRKGCFH